MDIKIENSAKAIIVTDDRILLVKNRDVAGLGIWYSLPGGRQKAEESLTEALLREIGEETGYAVKVGELLFVREYIHVNHELKSYGNPTHKIEFMFECRLVGKRDQDPQNRILDEEQVDLVWMPTNELINCNILPRKLQGYFESDFRKENTYWGDILF